MRLDRMNVDYECGDNESKGDEKQARFPYSSQREDYVAELDATGMLSRQSEEDDDSAWHNLGEDKEGRNDIDEDGEDNINLFKDDTPDDDAVVSLEELNNAFSSIVSGMEGNLDSTSTSSAGDVDDRINSIINTATSNGEMKNNVMDERKRHEKRLQAWSTDNGGHLKNVRALLSTIHTVMFERSRWKEIGMSDVLTAKDVARQYRNAMRAFHTDRLPKDATAEEIAIAETIYNAVQKAKKIFDKKEGRN